MSLWIELAARAARDEEPYRAPLAVLLLATVDGLALLDAVGHGAAADNAAERWSCPWTIAGTAAVERKEAL